MAFNPGVTMPWGESVRLFQQLLYDPASHVFAAINEWEYPLSREAIGQDNLLETYLRAHHDKKRGQFKSLPRPWPDPNTSKTKKPTVSQAEVRAALARRGHGAATEAAAAEHLLSTEDAIEPEVRQVGSSVRTTRQPRDERGRFAKRG